MKENESISWHPSFAAALQLELKEYENELQYLMEYSLTSEPLKVDVIILKSTKKPIEKNIGNFFRMYNIVEYKSPKDYISVDDFYKSVAYVYLFKYVDGQKKGIDRIDIRQMTLTLVSLHLPNKLLGHLQEREIEIYSYQEGVYYIQGMDIPIQLIVQNELPKEENEYLTLLTDRLEQKEQLQSVLNNYINDNKNELYRLIFYAIAQANPNLFMEVLNMQKVNMGEKGEKLLDELVRYWELDKKLKEEGKIEVALNLLSKGMSLEDIVEVTGLPLNKLEQIQKRV